MGNFGDMRKYQRCPCPVCKVLLSVDRTRWNEIELVDISAGGLKFVSDTGFEPEKLLYFDLSMYNKLSEFDMKLEGRIIRRSREKNMHCYAVKFDDMDRFKRVQLDEVIRSAASVQHSGNPAVEDGIYAFLLHKGKPARMRLYR